MSSKPIPGTLRPLINVPDPNCAYQPKWTLITRTGILILLYCHGVISSYDHTSIPSHGLMIPYHHIVPSQCCRIIHHTAKTVSPFWPKSQQKNGNRLFYPSAKSHTDLKLGSSGVVFRDGPAKNAQKNAAPPKRLFLDLTPKIFDKKFAEKKFLASKNEISGIV